MKERISVETQKIKFISNRFWLTKNSKSIPVPSSKDLPEWWSKGDRFFKDPSTNEYATFEDGSKMPTWKACHSFMDAMISGYSLVTPCDIEFYINEEGFIDCKTNDKKNKSFCVVRDPMPQFQHPKGYYTRHFSWLIDWGVELPEGYSALYLTPMNRFDLPFVNTVGIIDNDVVHLSGNIPFFLLEGFTGVIPAGTPYAQIFPFKRENWKSEIYIEDPKILPKKNHDNSLKYRIPNGGVYKNVDWHRKSYE